MAELDPRRVDVYDGTQMCLHERIWVDGDVAYCETCRATGHHREASFVIDWRRPPEQVGWLDVAIFPDGTQQLLWPMNATNIDTSQMTPVYALCSVVPKEETP